MVIAIHQPDYIPYLGYFYKMSKADYFVFLDDVQFSNNNMHHWNKIGSPQGELRLKIPVDYHFKDLINQVRTKDELGWKKKHLELIMNQYEDTPYYGMLFPILTEFLNVTYANLAHMNIRINQRIGKEFGFTCEFVKSSDFDIQTKREERVIDLCHKLNGTVYFSGNGARAYQQESNFVKAQLKLQYTDYIPKEYTQKWSTFQSNLSVIDYIFHHGFDWERMEHLIRQKDG